jgi:hypothetical protein
VPKLKKTARTDILCAGCACGRRPFTEVCKDAPGFDRGAFHQQLDTDVLAFFRTHFGDH